MSPTTYGFIGLGLIGGSLAKSIKRVYGEAARILAYDIHADTLAFAKEEGVIDFVCEQIDASFKLCDYIFLCAPVFLNDKNLTALKPFLSSTCILTDVGSVKCEIHKTVEALGLSSCFIGGHPMAGSEKTGFLHASDRLIENAYYILTPTDNVPAVSVEAYQKLVASLGALPLLLSYTEHDYITAAISHLPHIIAASLVNLVKDSDSKEGTMKLIAAGGFKDITRIASSSADMWQQISLLNRNNISVLLKDYISSLSLIAENLDQEASKPLYDLFNDAADYRDSFSDYSRGPIKKIYLIYVDIPDETGVIATISTVLAAHQINLKNIGIINNREFEEGALRIEFYDDSSMQRAVTVLNKHNYSIYKRN